MKGHIDLEKVALDYLKPIVARYGFTLAAGTFGGRGNVEYSPEVAISTSTRCGWTACAATTRTRSAPRSR